MKYRYREPHEMKDSGVEWLGMIPMEWEVSKFFRTFKEFNGQGFPNEFQGKEVGELPFFKVSDINSKEKYVELANNYVDNSLVLEKKWNILSYGTIILPKIGEALKKNHRKILKRNGLIDNNLVGLLPKKGNVNYNYYLLKCINMEWYLNPGAVPSINMSFLRESKIVIPNLNNQQKIADFLDLKCGEFDSIIEKKESLITKLEEAKKSLISEVVTGKVKVIEKENGSYEIGKREPHEMKDSGVEWLGMIPREWEVSKLKYSAIINPSKKQGINLFEEVSFVPMESVKLGKIRLEYAKKVEEVISGYTYFENGDILLAKVTPCFENKNLGICENLINGIGFGSTELNTIRPREKEDLKFFYYFLQEENFIKKGASTMIGTGGLKRIPTEFLNNCPIPYTDKQDQQKIADFLDLKCGEFDSTIEKQKELIEKLKKAKQSLISEAVTGKIEVL